MSTPSETVTTALLKEWGLPEPGNSKKSRGRVIVVGGSRRSPGAVQLAGEAAMRVGAGRLGLVVPQSVDAQLSVTMPEAAILALPDDADKPLTGSLRDEVGGADAVLVGPGFDDADETRATLLAVAEARPPCLVLDAYGLGVLPAIDRSALPAALILNPNEEEAARLLDRELGDDRLADLREIAERYDAVVNCYGTIVSPNGQSWVVEGGGPGLGTSGSGDVLAGAITGFAARGVPPERAAVWGSWAHAWAGDRLTERAGLGFLARQLPEQLAFAVLDALG